MENIFRLCDTIAMGKETIGVFIRKLRKGAKLTQKQLGAEISMSDRVISAWETGEYVPGRDALSAMSAFFNVSIDEFMRRIARDSDRDQELVKTIQDEIEKKRQQVIDVVDDLIAADPRKLDEFIRYGEWLHHQSESSPEDQ